MGAPAGPAGQEAPGGVASTGSPTAPGRLRPRPRGRGVVGIDVEAVRGDFPQLGRKVHGEALVYFDNAATTLKPRAVIDAVRGYYENDAANVHRGAHFLSELGTEAYEKARGTVQNFINGAFDHEVVLTGGVTESVNLVASSWGRRFLKKGDVVLVSGMEHHSNIVPWQEACERAGAQVEEVPLARTGDDCWDIDHEAYGRLLESHEGRVRMVAVSLVGNVLGSVNDVRRMADAAKERPDPPAVFVDAAQAAGHVPLDAGGLGCDFLAFSGHKMFGPMGTGALYARQHLLEEMPPWQTGGGMIDRVDLKEGTTFLDRPHRFEAGTPDVAGVLGLAAAVGYLEGLGVENVRERERRLRGRLLSGLLSVKGVRVFGPRGGDGAAIVPFLVDGVHPHDLAVLLDRQGVAVRSGHHCAQPLMRTMGVESTVRASLAFYNTEDEIDRFLAAVEKARGIAR